MRSERWKDSEFVVLLRMLGCYRQQAPSDSLSNTKRRYAALTALFRNHFGLSVKSIPLYLRRRRHIDWARERGPVSCGDDATTVAWPTRATKLELEFELPLHNLAAELGAVLHALAVTWELI